MFEAITPADGHQTSIAVLCETFLFIVFAMGMFLLAKKLMQQSLNDPVPWPGAKANAQFFFVFFKPDFIKTSLRCNFKVHRTNREFNKTFQSRNVSPTQLVMATSAKRRCDGKWKCCIKRLTEQQEKSEVCPLSSDMPTDDEDQHHILLFHLTFVIDFSPSVCSQNVCLSFQLFHKQFPFFCLLCHLLFWVSCQWNNFVLVCIFCHLDFFLLLACGWEEGVDHQRVLSLSTSMQFPMHSVPRTMLTLFFERCLTSAC